MRAGLFRPAFFMPGREAAALVHAMEPRIAMKLESAVETVDFAESADNQSVSQTYVFTSQAKTPPTRSFLWRLISVQSELSAVLYQSP
jgi:hypothetical protein